MRSVLVVGILALSITACAGIPGDGTDSPGSAETPTTAANAPVEEDSSAPPSTNAAQDRQDGLDGNAIWVALGLTLLLVGLAWLVGRWRRPTPPRTP